jgi:hypothetical protein
MQKTGNSEKRARVGSERVVVAVDPEEALDLGEQIVDLSLGLVGSLGVH